MKPNFLIPKAPTGEPMSAPEQDPSMEQGHVAEIKQAIDLIKAGQPDQAIPVLEQLLQGEESEIEPNPLEGLKANLASALK